MDKADKTDRMEQFIKNGILLLESRGKTDEKICDLLNTIIKEMKDSGKN